VREIPLYTLDGVPDADVRTYYFPTEDGLGLSLMRFSRGTRATESVLVIHGLTTSTDMFIMPEHRNLVTYLLDNGYSDVWCIDFRMSNRYSYNLFKHRYNMDDIALYDFPPALELMRQHNDGAPIHVICHCLGAVSFLMSLFGGAVDGIASVIANSVGLTPRVPAWSRAKLYFAPVLVEDLIGLPYLNPRWSEDPGPSRGKLFSKVVTAFHKECDEQDCHMLSLMWGTGWPALYSHEKLSDVTHRRGGDLYGATSMHYYRHVRKMVAAGNAVKMQPGDPRYDRLPDDYLENAADIQTPVLLATGDRNNVFRDSNIVCHRELERRAPGRHELAVLPGYGHQDPFMGEHVAEEVFPTFLDFLERHRSGATAGTAGAARPAEGLSAAAPSPRGSAESAAVGDKEGMQKAL
jgi:cholesterol oxidase